MAPEEEAIDETASFPQAATSTVAKRVKTRLTLQSSARTGNAEPNDLKPKCPMSVETQNRLSGDRPDGTTRPLISRTSSKCFPLRRASLLGFATGKLPRI